MQDTKWVICHAGVQPVDKNFDEMTLLEQQTHANEVLEQVDMGLHSLIISLQSMGIAPSIYEFHRMPFDPNRIVEDQPQEVTSWQREILSDIYKSPNKLVVMPHTYDAFNVDGSERAAMQVFTGAVDSISRYDKVGILPDKVGSLGWKLFGGFQEFSFAQEDIFA